MGPLRVRVPDSRRSFVQSFAEKNGWIFEDPIDGEFFLDLEDVPQFCHSGFPRSSVQSAFSGAARPVKGGKEVLFRAIGALKKTGTVWDLTAGLGRDSRMLMEFGYQVEMFERHPLIYLLLYFSLPQGQQHRLHYLPDWQGLIERPAPSVVYFDPMYDNPSKKSAPGLESQWLRQIVGEDEDAAEVAGFCCQHWSTRLVIKRPKAAPELLTGVSTSFAGSSTRYDMYLTKSTKEREINGRG